MIKGICVGGGLEIAALCDLRICGESSRFGVPINRLGLVMAYAEIEGLLRSGRPRDRARDPARRPRLRRARRPRTKGLVTRVVPDDEVERGGATPRRSRIADGAPLVARWHKKFARRLRDPRRSSTERRSTRATPASAPRISGSAIAAFLAKTQAGVQGPLTRMPGPLAGLKVIELAHIMAGPTCGLMLADMGADVIKVEKLPGGDDTRRSMPPTIDGESAAFMMMNRNKRGIAVDLKQPTAAARCCAACCASADVVIENFRRGTMERLGPRLRRAAAATIPA